MRNGRAYLCLVRYSSQMRDRLLLHGNKNLFQCLPSDESAARPLSSRWKGEGVGHRRIQTRAQFAAFARQKQATRGNRRLHCTSKRNLPVSPNGASTTQTYMAYPTILPKRRVGFGSWLGSQRIIPRGASGASTHHESAVTKMSSKFSQAVGAWCGQVRFAALEGAVWVHSALEGV